MTRAKRDSCLRLLSVGLAVILSACNPGQCLRQSDCPMGATCKKGVCKVPPAAPRQTKDAGNTPSPTDSNANNESTIGSSSISTLADAAASSSGVSTANSGQSSNIDSATDTAATLEP